MTVIGRATIDYLHELLPLSGIAQLVVIVPTTAHAQVTVKYLLYFRVSGTGVGEVTMILLLVGSTPVSRGTGEFGPHETVLNKGIDIATTKEGGTSNTCTTTQSGRRRSSTLREHRTGGNAC